MRKILWVIVCLWTIDCTLGELESHSYCYPLFESESFSEDGNGEIQKRNAEEEQMAVSEAASNMGLEEDTDPLAVPSSLANCCFSRCNNNNGICLPSWLKGWFSCYVDNLCVSSWFRPCTCFMPRSYCETPCTSNCGGSGGTCRDTCSRNEVTSNTYTCGSNCNCCYECTETCSGGNGKCKKSCSSSETNEGKCLGHKNGCNCCVPKPACEGKCGTNGYCKQSCSSLETDVGQCLSLSDCRCCEPKAKPCSEGKPCGWGGYCTDPQFCYSQILPSGQCHGSSCICCGVAIMPPPGGDLQ